MVKKKSARKSKVKDTLDITDELIAERRTSLKMPKDMSLGIFKLVLLSAISSSVISKVSFTFDLRADFFLTI